jgi:hypothetical protein
LAKQIKELADVLYTKEPPQPGQPQVPPTPPPTASVPKA